MGRVKKTVTEWNWNRMLNSNEKFDPLFRFVFNGIALYIILQRKILQILQHCYRDIKNILTFE